MESFSANAVCHKRLDSRTCTDHDGEAYCNHCYRRMFGPKGYGFGGGAGTLSMDSCNTQQNGASNRLDYLISLFSPLFFFSKIGLK